MTPREIRLESIVRRLLRAGEPNRNRDFKEQIALYAFVVSLFALVLNAIGSLVAFNSLEVSRRSLVESNRAFVVPIGMRLTGSPEAGKDLPFDIIYVNSGKTLANAELDVETTVAFDPAPAPNGSISAGKNPTCAKSGSFRTQHVSVPNDAADHWSAGFFDRKLLTQEVISGEKALVVRGCFKYRTLGELHRSEFCYVAKLGDRISDSRNTIHCFDGNLSD